MNNTAKKLEARLDSKDSIIGICGLGYVGLPLAMAAARVGYKVIGFDVNQAYVDFQMLADNAALIIDSRNIMEKNGLTGDNIIKA